MSLLIRNREVVSNYLNNRMVKIKSLIREYEKEKDSFQKLVILGSIQNELEKTKKELSRKI